MSLLIVTHQRGYLDGTEKGCALYRGRQTKVFETQIYLVYMIVVQTPTNSLKRKLSSLACKNSLRPKCKTIVLWDG